jgi:hypothetical protein
MGDVCYVHAYSTIVWNIPNFPYPFSNLHLAFSLYYFKMRLFGIFTCEIKSPNSGIWAVSIEYVQTCPIMWLHIYGMSQSIPNSIYVTLMQGHIPDEIWKPDRNKMTVKYWYLKPSKCNYSTLSCIINLHMTQRIKDVQICKINPHSVPLCTCSDKTSHSRVNIRK